MKWIRSQKKNSQKIKSVDALKNLLAFCEDVIKKEGDEPVRSCEKNA